MAEITASTVVRFTDGSSAEGSVSVEIDSRENGLNAGKTSFNPGDSVGLLVYVSQGVSIKSVEVSIGSISAVGAQVVSENQYLQFAKTREASINPSVSGTVPGTWVGNNGGPVTAKDGKATITKEGVVGMFYAQISATAQGYVLDGVPAEVAGVEEINVLIVVTAEKAK